MKPVIASILVAATAYVIVRPAGCASGVGQGTEESRWFIVEDHGDKPGIGWTLYVREGRIERAQFSLFDPEHPREQAFARSEWLTLVEHTPRGIRANLSLPDGSTRTMDISAPMGFSGDSATVVISEEGRRAKELLLTRAK